MHVLDLWMPIVASGVATHVASTLAWTVLPHHKPEWKRVPLDSSLGEALDRAGAAPGGQYVLVDPEGDEKDPASCQGTLVRWAKRPNMGANIGLTISYFLLVATVIGYLASIAMTSETPQTDVFRFAATAGFLVFVLGGQGHVIWFRRRVLMEWIDGLVFALITGGIFAVLWPAAS